MSALDGIRGLLIDVDGTLLDGEAAIAGAVEALASLRSRGLAIRLTTNTTRRPRSATAAALRSVGFEVAREEILIPASLARRRIVGSGRARASLLLPEATFEDFDGVVVTEERPDWVVVGDLGAGFSFERLNRAFLHLHAGAALLALQKNRFWLPKSGGALVLDAGPFVEALEFASGVAAEVVGKPSRRFFDLALEDIGLPPGQVLVVGDDVVNDVQGGASAGCRTALVRTGKYREGDGGRSRPESNVVLASFTELVS